MAASSESSFALGQAVMYYNFYLTVNTFVFGAYSVLVFLTIRLFRQRGLRATSSRVLLTLSISMYLVTTGFWAYSVAFVVGATQNYIDPTNREWTNFFSRVTIPFKLWNAIVLVNINISDGIVIWRAWVLCRRNRRLFVLIPSIFLLFTVSATSGLITLRIFEVATSPFSDKSLANYVISVLQLCNMTTSLLSNISATAIIGVAARAHRRVVQHSLKRTKTTAIGILFFLLETGALYCANGVISIISQLIRLPYGTLNDLLLGVIIQFAGAYAPAILLLVNARMSQSDAETEALDSLPSTMASNIAHSTKPHENLFHSARGGKTPVISMLQFAGTSSLELEDIFSRYSPTAETTRSTVLNFSRETPQDRHSGEENAHCMSDFDYV